MLPERVNEIRNRGIDAEALALCLHLDLPQDEIDWYMDKSSAQVLVLNRRVSLALVRLLASAQPEEVIAPGDEAARAIDFMLTLGVDRQAMLAPALEGIYNTLPDNWTEPDPFPAMNAAAGTHLNIRTPACGMDPGAALGECERMLFGEEAA